MTSSNLAGELAELVKDANPDALPAIAAACASAQVLVMTRLLATSTPQQKPKIAEHWITPKEAARIAELKVDTPEDVRRARSRIYYWAAGKTWARRPTERTLQVEEGRFRAWLASR